MIHIRYMNDTKITEIGSVSRARYTLLSPHQRAQSRDFVSSVYRHVSRTHLLPVDTPSIHVRYTHDTERYKLWGKATTIHMGKETGYSTCIGILHPYISRFKLEGESRFRKNFARNFDEIRVKISKVNERNLGTVRTKVTPRPSLQTPVHNFFYCD